MVTGKIFFCDAKKHNTIPLLQT